MREPILREMTSEEYLVWEDAQLKKFELHHGFALAFAGGTLDHDRIAFNLRAAFELHFAPPCRTFGSDVKIRVSEKQYYYCDAGVICEPIAGSSSVIDRAWIVCEVLSPSTRGFDLVDKRAAYRSMTSLEAYVIIHTESLRVEVDARDLAGNWATGLYDAEPALIAGVWLSHEEIFARTSLLVAEEH